MTWIWFILLGTISLVARLSISRWLRGWQEPTLRFWRNWGLLFFAFWATFGLGIEGMGFMHFVAAIGGVMGFFAIAELLRRGGENRNKQYTERVNQHFEQLRKQAAKNETEQKTTELMEQAKQRRAVKIPIAEPPVTARLDPGPAAPNTEQADKLDQEKRQAAADIVQLISAATDMWEQTQRGEEPVEEPAWRLVTGTTVKGDSQPAEPDQPAAEIPPVEDEPVQEAAGQAEVAQEAVTEEKQPAAVPAAPSQPTGPPKSGPVPRIHTAESETLLTAHPVGPVSLGLSTGAKESPKPVKLGENRFSYQPQLVTSRLKDKAAKPAVVK
ncbi:hypothetical protein JW859_04615 [bacterium]|nr:hypothetical protein [bacterium]